MRISFKNTVSTTMMVLLLTACGTNGIDVKPVDNRTKAQKQRDEHGSFFGLGDIGKKKNVGETIGVNAYLWRGALDTLSINPLDKIDVKNGIIQTEWVAISTAEQVRIGAVIVSSNLQVDALRVNVYKRVKENGTWVSVKVSKETTDKISDAILQRARELRLAEES